MRYVIAVIILLATSYVTPVFACDCANISNETRRQSASVIFTGTALRSNENIVEFSVLEVHKGTVATRIVVTIDPGMCLYKIEEGATMLIAASDLDGKLVTDGCSGNELISREPPVPSSKLARVIIIVLICIAAAVTAVISLRRKAA